MTLKLYPGVGTGIQIPWEPNANPKFFQLGLELRSILRILGSGSIFQNFGIWIANLGQNLKKSQKPQEIPKVIIEFLGLGSQGFLRIVWDSTEILGFELNSENFGIGIEIGIEFKNFWDWDWNLFFSKPRIEIGIGISLSWLYCLTPIKVISDETNFWSNQEDIFATKYNNRCSSNLGGVHLFLTFKAVEDAKKLKTLSVQIYLKN